MHRVRQQPTAAAGFTLIELMVAVVVVALLATVALPYFRDAILKSRRSEAVSALGAVQQAQERWRSKNAAYAGSSQLTSLPTASPPGLGLSATTPSGYYGIALSNDSAVGYTATATAAGGQAGDTRCALMAVQVDRGNVSYGSGTSAVDMTDANRCWAR